MRPPERERGLFVWPRTDAFYPATGAYRGAYRSYSHYNYLRPGIVAWMKRRRLAVSLALARPWFGAGAAIDFGCGDGILLASLARHFSFVAGVDRDPAACAIASAVVSDLELANVHLVCTAGRPSLRELAALLPAPPGPAAGYGIAFALETLEHIGDADPAQADAARVDAVGDLFALLTPDARMIVSVPRTTGPAFLLKYAAQRILGHGGDDDPLPLRDALRAGLWGDTTRVAARWRGGHVGFNDRTFERALARAARIVRRRTTALSVCYLLASRTRAMASEP